MNIFNEVKARVSARKVAEAYGLKVRRNGMANCPFHNDKSPSLLIDDNHYYCFGCGAHGDAIGYVAESFETSQYEAACKINEDFSLGIDAKAKLTNAEIDDINQQKNINAKISGIREKFNKWRLEKINELKECEELIRKSEEAVMNADPHGVFLSNGFAYLMHVKSIIEYWLDILCLGTEEEQKEFLARDGKEVVRIASNVRRAGDEILGRYRRAVG